MELACIGEDWVVVTYYVLFDFINYSCRFGSDTVWKSKLPYPTIIGSETK